MKVLQANNYGYLRGGSEVCYFATQELLKSNGHEIADFHVANEKNSRSIWSEYWPEGIDLNKPTIPDLAKFVYSAEARRKISDLCDKFRPDLAHLHIYYGQLTTSIIGELKSRKIPVVQTLHEYKLLCPVSTFVCNEKICQACNGKNFWHTVERRCNKGSLTKSLLSATETYVSKMLGSWDDVTHFIAVSDFLRNQMIGAGLAPEKISTIHNFIDLSGMQPSEVHGNYFLYFGRLEKIKGVMTLLSAMRHVSGELIIVGDGTARLEMEEYILLHNIKNVSLVGFKRGVELYDLIRGSRCVIAPSEWYETFGLVLIEAFAFAKPVIASRIGGMTEIVDEGVNGLLFSSGNEMELIGALEWMWSHPEEALLMGKKGRVLVEEKFSPRSHYEKLIKLYKQVI